MSTNRTVRRTDGHRHSTKVIPVTIAMIFVVGVVSGTVTMSSGVGPDSPAVTAPWQVAAHATGAGGQPVCPNADAATELMPAPGFDPLTGSTAELRAQDFPPRPTHSADLAAWTDYAKRYLSGAAFVCPSDPTAPSSSNAGLVGVAGAQPGWAGWVLHNAYFTDSSNEFVAAGATGGPDAYVAYWAGVNWVNTNHYPLIQAGLQVNGAGTSCQLIYDAYPVNPHDTGLGHVQLRQPHRVACPYRCERERGPTTSRIWKPAATIQDPKRSLARPSTGMQRASPNESATTTAAPHATT